MALPTGFEPVSRPCRSCRAKESASGWPFGESLIRSVSPRDPALGFRRGPDTWVVRFRDRDGKHQYKSLGDSLEFDEAKRRAESWLAQLAGSAVRKVKRSTVRGAVEAYIADLRRHGRLDTARGAASCVPSFSCCRTNSSGVKCQAKYGDGLRVIPPPSVGRPCGSWRTGRRAPWILLSGDGSC
jgi:hypothetical protein